MLIKEFKSDTVICVNGTRFVIAKAEELTSIPGTYELTGTLDGDPSFIRGKRTIFTAYLKEWSCGSFSYDWDAK